MIHHRTRKFMVLIIINCGGDGDRKLKVFRGEDVEIAQIINSINIT